MYAVIFIYLAPEPYLGLDVYSNMSIFLNMEMSQIN